MTKTSALSSLFTAASKSFNTVGSAFDTLNNGIDMADRFVSKASDEQRKRYLKEAELFDDRLAHELSEETTELQRKSDEYKAQLATDELRQTYNETYTTFLARLKGN